VQILPVWHAVIPMFSRHDAGIRIQSFQSCENRWFPASGSVTNNPLVTGWALVSLYHEVHDQAKSHHQMKNGRDLIASC